MLPSVVMPCLNEAKTLARCIEKAKAAIKEMKVDGEIIVADNGSADNSVRIAESLEPSSSFTSYVIMRKWRSSRENGVNLKELGLTARNGALLGAHARFGALIPSAGRTKSDLIIGTIIAYPPLDNPRKR